MVAGSFGIRAWLDRRNEDKANPPGLVCIPELADLCRHISDTTDVNVTVEPAGQTAGRMTALNGTDGIDGWLTLSKWPAIAEGRRQTKVLPPFFTSVDNPVLARSRVGFAVWPDRAAAIEQSCKPVQWKCLGTVAQGRLWKNVPGGSEAWGPVKLGFPEAGDGALGLAAFAAATVDYFGKADVSTIDFEDDGYGNWVHALSDASPSRFPDVSTFLAQGPAIEDVYVGIEAQLEAAVRGSARPDKPRLIYPSPVTADLVLAVVPGRAGERLRDIVGDAVRERLLKSGWQAPSAGTGDGLPEPGVLDALRQVWKEAA